jgi:integrase
MARVRDLWYDKSRRKTSRHPDIGGNPKAKRWLALWGGTDGQEHSKAFAKQTDAVKYATAMEADALRGIRYADPRRGAVTVREYAETRWLPAQHHHAPHTGRTYRAHLANQILPLIGSRRIGTVTRTDIKSLVAAMRALSGEPLAASTVHTVFAVLRAMFTSAVDDGIIVVNPCTRVPLPRVRKSAVEPMATAMVLALYDAMPGRFRVAVALGAGAGLREGEALGLTVPRADFLRRRLLIRKQAQDGRLAPLKSEKSERIVPADDWVLDAISAHLAAGFGPGPDQVIMTSVHDRIVPTTTFTDDWRDAVAEVGLPKGTRFHDLRHFYASTLIAANLNPKVIQARLGHATISETMDTYGHLFPDSEDLGRGVVDKALERARTEQRRNSGRA